MKVRYTSLALNDIREIEKIPFIKREMFIYLFEKRISQIKDIKSLGKPNYYLKDSNHRIFYLGSFKIFATYEVDNDILVVLRILNAYEIKSPLPKRLNRYIKLTVKGNTSEIYNNGEGRKFLSKNIVLITQNRTLAKKVEEWAKWGEKDSVFLDPEGRFEIEVKIKEK